MLQLSWLPWLSKQKIILASASPRRREILTDMGLEFQIVTTLEDDSNDPTAFDLKEDYVHYTARLKAVEVFERCRDDSSLPDADIVIGADTVVVLDKTNVLEKPRDADDAKRMLRELSGKQHTAMTSVVILQKSSSEKGYKEYSFVSKTDVDFYDIDNGILEAYVASGEPFGKAGAYGIQGPASMFVKGIHGDYWNVVGLPKSQLYQKLLTLEKSMLKED
ncbi:inosine triphosphate pyrophosphatase-like protein [Circinella umbellata]|nr:inosine triphosphate pyrophosphatase-like protein [Circinella umbellata]